MSLMPFSMSALTAMVPIQASGAGAGKEQMLGKERQAALKLHQTRQKGTNAGEEDSMSPPVCLHTASQ